MRILALVDHSIYAQSVIGYAADVASTTGAEVDLLHVISRRELLETTLVGYHPGGVAMMASNVVENEEQILADARRRGEVLLLESHTALLARGAGLVRTHVVEGDVPTAAQEAQVEARLIVMGKRGEHADFARLPLGANVEQIVRTSRSPVLLVPRSHRPINSCVVAFDGSDASRAVVEVLAKSRLFAPMPSSLLHIGDADEQLRAAMVAAAQDLTAAGFETDLGVEPGLPEKAIPERVVLGKFDLVAMGAFGISRIKSLIFGSLTKEMVRATQTPVLLAR